MSLPKSTPSDIQTLCTSIIHQYPSINHILLLCLCYEYDPEYTQYSPEQLDEIASNFRTDQDWAKISRATSFQDNELGDYNDELPAVLQKIQQLFNACDPEQLTNAMGYLIAEESRTDGLGAIVTPISITTLIAKLMQPQANESVYDPTCKSGCLLTACSNLANVELFGQETILKQWITAQLSLMLYGQRPYNITHNDCLLHPFQQHQLQKFDIVISNPPWGKFGKDLNIEDDLQRFKWGIPTRLDYAYISHMVASMKPEHGRMTVLVQHGVLFRSAMEATIRQKLIEGNLLDAVIALPEKMIPFMSAPMVLLIFKQQRPDTSVLWIDASQDFIADKYQNTFSEQHINDISELYLQRQNVPQRATLVRFETIKNNQFKLNIPLYIKPQKNTELHDLKAIQQKRQQLMAQWKNLQQQLDDALQSQ